MTFTRNIAAWIVLAVLGVGACTPDVQLPPGRWAPESPVQTNLAPNQVHVVGRYTVRPLATFALKARVLGKERYRWSRGADLSPVDLALGWGPMSDQSVIDRIRITQRGRFYYWRVSDDPIPHRDIVANSANMHMIPADEQVRAELLAVREGELIGLEGKLVVASTEDGWVWRSSLSRTDTGDGACELIWVERVERIPVEAAMGIE